jgi:hypothetical protein
VKKRLVLKSETVAELSHSELTGAAVGASGPTCWGAGTCPVLNCASDMIRGCANLTMGCTTP